MEWWNNGIMGKKISGSGFKPSIPIFQYSNIPWRGETYDHQPKEEDISK
jgi:hypothetical protein